MSPQQQAAAAARLSQGRTRREPMAPLPEHLRPADPAEAYAVQRLLHEHFREAGLGEVAGYKVGCTSPVMQAYLQVDHPCAGGVLSPTVWYDGARLEHGAFCRVGVECEVAVRLAADLPPRGTPYTRDEAARAVAQVMPAIEVVDDRWHDFTAIDTPSLVADDFFGAGCVLGEPRAFDPSLDLATLAGDMTVNGESAGQGTGRDILGHPLHTLVWLAGSGAAPQGLRAGQLVLLGSMVKTRWLEPGDRVTVSIDGLGRVAATFR